MMNNLIPTIRTLLSSHQVTLRDTFRVSRLAVFGSVARGEQQSDSDIDVLVEFSCAVGWEFFDLSDYLEHLLRRPIDMTTLPALRPEMREQILRETIDLYNA
jgi:uncharacterized protein